jgi:hypothetical protein
MKTFNEFVKEGKVLKKSTDSAEAKSLMKQAEERLFDLKQLPLKDSNASFRYEDAYEVVREALHAFLARAGYKPYSHAALFSYALEKKILTEADCMSGDRYRVIRNDINYRGKKVTMDETKEIINYVQRVFPVLKEEFMKQ